MDLGRCFIVLKPRSEKCDVDGLGSRCLDIWACVDQPVIGEVALFEGCPVGAVR